MKNIINKIALLILLQLSVVIVFAQDTHYSQYDFSAIMLNPAATGKFKGGEIRAISQYRNQWNSVSSQFATTSFAFDLPVKERWGAGMYIVNTDANRIFNNLSLVLSGAYDVFDPTNRKHLLTTGLQIGFIHKSLNRNNYIFDNQYQGGFFNSDIPHGEDLLHYQRFMPELNYGIHYEMINPEEKVRPHAGVALMHILNPRDAFILSDASRLPLRYVGTAGVKIVLDDMMFNPKLLYMYQRQASELMLGFDSRYNVKQDDVKAIAGFFYRHKDALVPMLGIEYYKFTFQFGYDINISSLNQFSRGRGAWEFSLGFIGAVSKLGGVGVPRPF